MMDVRAKLNGKRWRRAALGVMAAVAGLAFGTAAAKAQTGTVNFTVNQQQVEGFGFSQAFGASQSVSYLSQSLQNQVWDLMFNPKTGAGLDVLRIGFNTGYDIEPNSPGSPSATPTYQWDGSDGRQVQTAQIAQHYGVNDFFAVSWTAPNYMKTNNSDDNGGSLCGVTGTIGGGITNSCNGQDWRQAYANYLVQYVNDYKSAGVPIGALGVQNEPDYTATYQSMNLTPAQVADFVNNAFGPTVRSKLPGVRTMCCDSINWAGEQPYTGTLPYYAPFNSYIDISTGHEYGSHATFPQPFTTATTKPSWMTEWATLNTTDELRWDCGGCSGGPDGMYLANDIISAFNAGNVSEYNYWWGTVNQANALVEIYLSLTAPGYYEIPGRYYAVAAHSRYVRPGAYRVATTNTNTNLNVVAFRNTDGSKVLEILNNGTAATTGSFTVDAATGATGGVKTLLTDQTDSLNETDSAVVTGTQLSVPLPPRSLTTVLLPPTQTAGNVQLVLTSTVTKLGDGSYEAAVKITNNGTGTVQGLTLTTGSLGSAQGAPSPISTLPEVAGTGAIAPGGYTIVPLNYAASAGGSGSMVMQKYSGTYSGGSFNSTLRTVLP